jgi:hypothetical protein
MLQRRILSWAVPFLSVVLVAARAAGAPCTSNDGTTTESSQAAVRTVRPPGSIDVARGWGYACGAGFVLVVAVGSTAWRAGRRRRAEAK